jgi:hypothetical protein
LNSFITKHGSDKDLLIKEVKERLKEMKWKLHLCVMVVLLP